MSLQVPTETTVHIPSLHFGKSLFKASRSNLAGWFTTAQSMRDIRLTVLATVYVAACLYVACISNSVADRINPNNLLPVNQRRALPDPLMDAMNPVFKRWALPANLSDQLLLVAVVMILARAFTMGSQTFTTVRRVFFIAGAVYLLRACTVVITVLPNPLLECQSEPHPDLMYDAFLLFSARRVSCGDVFFSGHTIIFTTAILVWTTYSRSYALRTLAVLIGLAGMVSLIASAYHYTIDVLVGFWATAYVWTMYHWSVTLPSLRRTWWARFLYRLDNSEYYKKEGEAEESDMFSLVSYIELTDE